MDTLTEYSSCSGNCIYDLQAKTTQPKPKGRKIVRRSTSLFVLLLISVFTLSILAIVGSAFAQSLPKPSVPEFSAKVVDNTLEVTIKNQPLTPYENGSYPSLYYMFNYKDQNERDFYYDPVYFVLPSTYGGYYNASDSDFTIVSLSLEGRHFPSEQIDVRVIALVGNQYPTDMQGGTVYGFEGVVGSWSDIQTVTFEENADIPEFPSWILFPMLLTSTLIILIIKTKLKNKVLK